MIPSASDACAPRLVFSVPASEPTLETTHVGWNPILSAAFSASVVKSGTEYDTTTCAPAAWSADMDGATPAIPAAEGTYVWRLTTDDAGIWVSRPLIPS